MRSKMTVIIVFLIGFSMYFALSHSARAAIIMTDDGNSMKCLVDEEQSIKIKTSKGESVVKFKDIIWMAGKDEKRIRLKSKSELIIGEIEKKEIKVKKGEELFSILPENIIYFYNEDDINIETVGEIEIIEYDKGSFKVITEKKKNSADQNLSVRLLPHNWEGTTLGISNPSYAKKVTSWSDLKINIDIQESENLCYLTNNADKLRVALKIKIGDAQTYSSTPSQAKYSLMHDRNQVFVPVETIISIPLTITNLAKCVRKRAAIPLIFIEPFHQSNLEIYGNGQLFLYLTSTDKEQTFSGGQLKVIRTSSNVLRLPITILKQDAISPEEHQKFYVKVMKSLAAEKIHLSKRAHIRLIVADSKEKAETIYQELLRGASFIQMAKEKSIGPNHENGGDLGEASLSDLREEMQAVLKNIKQGQFTKVFQLDSKYGILYLESIIEPALQIDK